MKYIIGIDGGGTKTVCVLANELAEVLDVSQTGCSNHQICGIETAVDTIVGLIDSAVNRAGITREDIAFVKMGLAGADMDRDLKLLNSHFKKALPGMAFEIVNDIWIAFEAEIINGWGAISICGTGHNTAVLAPDGQTYGIIALKYVLGNCGGGRHITDHALHYAFRSSEKTGDYTRLEEFLPEYCNTRDMNELADKIYQSDYTYQYQFNIPKLVFDLAEEGDTISRKIIIHEGTELGRMTAGLIHKAGIRGMSIPVVLAGSIFTNYGSALMVNSYKESLSKYVPDFSIHILRKPPVLGAVLNALKKINVSVNSVVADKAMKNIEAFTLFDDLKEVAKI